MNAAEWLEKFKQLMPEVDGYGELLEKIGLPPDRDCQNAAIRMWNEFCASTAPATAEEPKAAPRGTKTRGDRRLVDFLPDNSDEEWFHCKSPFLRFAVSNQRRVAWLVNAGHGVKAGKVATSRPRILWLKGKPLSVHSVRLTDDTGKKREMNVEWLFQNAAGKPKKQDASQSGVT